MSVLEEEITGDIYACDSDGEEFSEQLSKPDDANIEQQQQSQNLSDKLNHNETKMLNLEMRLPAQVRRIRFGNALRKKYLCEIYDFSNVNVPIVWYTSMKFRVIPVVTVHVHNMDRWHRNSVRLAHYWLFIVRHT